jgi:hypothetical protein
MHLNLYSNFIECRSYHIPYRNDFTFLVQRNLQHRVISTFVNALAHYFYGRYFQSESQVVLLSLPIGGKDCIL